MKKSISVPSIAFAIALAVIVGTRLTPDAVAVIIGMIFGLLASIPTSLLLVWVLRQRDKQLEVQYQQSRPAQYPPVVVVNGQGTNGSYSSPPTPTQLGPASPPGSRNFKVVGQENTETKGDSLSPLWSDL